MDEKQKCDALFEMWWISQEARKTTQSHDYRGALLGWRACYQHLAPQWQPIETAPKDGTVIDLWCDQRRITFCYWGLPSHSCGEAGRYCDSDWHDLEEGWVDGMNEPFSEYRGKPTHWMPLPAAPDASCGQGKEKQQ